MMATAFDAVPDEIAESMGKVAKNFRIPTNAIMGLADTINYLDDNAISKGDDIINVLNRTSGVVSGVAMSARDAAALASTLLTLGERTERPAPPSTPSPRNSRRPRKARNDSAPLSTR
jgi:TP901 family phage tail tape measure protein